MDFDSFVLAAATADLADEPAAREHADAVEFRMDLADEPLDDLADYEGESPLICTNRIAAEGGEAADTDGRLDALARASEHDFVEAIDLELATLESGEAPSTAEHARRQDATVIASVHDFEETPEVAEMTALLERGVEAGDVGKLAVTAADAGDVLDLMRATWRLTSANERVATMAMGEAGRHSRAVAPCYGSRIGYAPVDPAKATAPGQYDLATLRSLVEGLADRT